MATLRAIIEALLFVSRSPELGEDQELLSMYTTARSRGAGHLRVEYAGRAMVCSGRVAQGYQLRTKPSMRLGSQAQQNDPTAEQAALETLAVIAYKSLSCGGGRGRSRVDWEVCFTCSWRKAHQDHGEKECGVAFLYGTTQRFLEVFTCRIFPPSEPQGAEGFAKAP